MRVCVQGLWHLGSVTAACLAAAGHQVTGLDEDPQTVADLNRGKAPVFEPGLDALLQTGLAQGRLRFFDEPAAALAYADVLWVCFDTPVDDDDRADVAYVESRVRAVLPLLRTAAVVVVSSQLPVGSVRKLEDFARRAFPDRSLDFACSPENLRLGKAIQIFRNPDRIVIGARNDRARTVISKLLTPLTDRLEWMSVESAEMTKHAINSFLALSVTFANEIATVCETVGADAKQVERGLKSESRIGPGAYVAPGGAFAGGTLARDVEFLGHMTRAHGLSMSLLTAVHHSNNTHKQWAYNKLREQLGDLDGRCIAVWGLTYKPGTDTLRRSLSVELCDRLLQDGAAVRVFDPAVATLPSHWEHRVTHCPSALDAVAGAHAMVVGTEWPQFRDSATVLAGQVTPPSSLIVIDANRHLASQLARSGVRYIAVGSAPIAKE